VKVVRTRNNELLFQLGKRERQLLLDTISLYPLVPDSHHRLSRQTAVSVDENQRLLEQSLAEQRGENRRQVLALLNEPGRFRETQTGFELTLTPAETEWLLQVLNDVRVGSWLALGEPEPDEEPEVNEENAKYLLAMELCGLFQSVLLAALGVRESSQWFGTDET
jgi:hypothetical protein